MPKLGIIVASLVAAAPAHAQPAPPPGATRATFVSATADRWDVLVDRVPACATPCALWLAPLQFVSLRVQERNPYRVDVGHVPPASDVVVTAEPLSNGAYATGITFTALGGMALVTGITLTAVGCTTDHDGMCTAGLITGVSGAAVTLGSIWLMRRALPRASVVPAVGAQSAGIAGVF